MGKIGGLFSSKQESSSTQTSTPTFPSYLKTAMRDVVDLGQEYADTPYSPYGDPRFANFTPDELQAFDLTRSLLGAYQPDMDYASSALRDVTRQGLQGIDQSLIDAYANPFTTMVMDQRRNRSFEDFARAKSDLSAQKANIGAFGGSRLGLQEANLFDEFEQRLADEEAEMLMNRFDRSISGAQDSLTRAQQGAVDTGNMASMHQSLGLQDSTALSGIGGQQRALEQAGLDFDYEQWMNSQLDPLTRAQGLLSVVQPVSALNRGENTVATQKSSSSQSPFQVATGLAGMAKGLGGMFGGSSIASSMLAGAPYAIQSHLTNPYTGGLSSGAIQMASAGGNYLSRARGGLIHSYKEGGLASLLEKVKEFDRSFSESVGRTKEATLGGLEAFIQELSGQGANVRDSLLWDAKEFPVAFGKTLGQTSDLYNLITDKRELDPRTATGLDQLGELARGMLRVPEEAAGLFADNFGSRYKGVYDFFNTPLSELERQKQEGKQQQGGLPSDLSREAFDPANSPEALLAYFSGIPDSLLAKQPEEDAGGGITPSSGVGGGVGGSGNGYEALLSQIRGSVPQEHRKKSVFEDPLFNWGLALVTGRDPIAAYSGMSDEGRKGEMQPITKEDAIRKMALEQLQTETNRRQVEAQVAGVATPEERAARLDLLKAQTAESLAKSFGGGGNREVVKSFRDLVKGLPEQTLRNPTLRRSALEAIGKNLAIQYNMTEDEVLNTLQQSNQ